MALLIHILIPHVILKVVHTLINIIGLINMIKSLFWIEFSFHVFPVMVSEDVRLSKNPDFSNSHDPPRSWQIQISDIFWILAFPVSFWPIISFLDNSAILLNSIPRHGFNEIRGAMFSYLDVPIYLCGNLSKKGCWGSCSLKEIVFQ